MSINLCSCKYTGSISDLVTTKIHVSNTFKYLAISMMHTAPPIILVYHSLPQPTIRRGRQHSIVMYVIVYLCNSSPFTFYQLFVFFNEMQ